MWPLLSLLIGYYYYFFILILILIIFIFKLTDVVQIFILLLTSPSEYHIQISDFSLYFLWNCYSAQGAHVLNRFSMCLHLNILMLLYFLWKFQCLVFCGSQSILWFIWEPSAAFFMCFVICGYAFVFPELFNCNSLWPGLKLSFFTECLFLPLLGMGRAYFAHFKSYLDFGVF